jgi:hypothetical protein
MKPTYLLALLLAVPAGLMIVWGWGRGNSGWKLMTAAMAPALVVCLVAKLDPPKVGPPK